MGRRVSVSNKAGIKPKVLQCRACVWFVLCSTILLGHRIRGDPVSYEDGRHEES